MRFADPQGIFYYILSSYISNMAGWDDLRHVNLEKDMILSSALSTALHSSLQSSLNSYLNSALHSDPPLIIYSGFWNETNLEEHNNMQ